MVDMINKFKASMDKVHCKLQPEHFIVDLGVIIIILIIIIIMIIIIIITIYQIYRALISCMRAFSQAP